jgi:MoaA/NifB/PqqE/SkfB family radical SAM enzyme
MFDLLAHMNSSIRMLIVDALKVSVRKPKQLAFFRTFFKNLGKTQAKREAYEKDGLHVPPFLIASITSNCNLFCTGCYARANQACGSSIAGKPLSVERWNELFTEAGELGICFILLAGGEPLLKPEVLEAAAQHPEIIFPIFTNGTLLDESMLELIDGHRNLLPIISLEGDRDSTDARRGEGVYDSIMDSMAKLKEKKILFGTSITVTRNNVQEVTDEAYIKRLRKFGCGLVFFIEYVPSDRMSRELAPTNIERALLEANIEKLKKASPMLYISFPGDEKYSGGCLAAGRGFVHINMDGSVEPCPFSPYSDTNLAGISLVKALKSPFLTSMRENGMLMGEHDGGCLLFERQAEVMQLLNESKNLNTEG